MEDSMISGGVMLSAICDRYEATKDCSLGERAAAVLAGMVRSATVSRSPGFLARSVSPRDGTSHYIESSRDQYTHFIHGLWRLYHSPLSDETQKETMRRVVTTICERMETHIVEANDYHFCREDGTRGLVDKMWKCDPHEVARLPMIYAVGWDFTGDQRWWRNYRQYTQVAASDSLKIPARMSNVYAYLQEQLSLEPLVAIETEDSALRNAWLSAMSFVASRTRRFSDRCLKHEPWSGKLADIDMDWRHWPVITWKPDEKLLGGHPHENHQLPDVIKQEFATIREPAEALLIQGMSPVGMDMEQIEILRRCVGQVDYDRLVSCSLFYCLAAYWRAVKRGYLSSSH